MPVLKSQNEFLREKVDQLLNELQVVESFIRAADAGVNTKQMIKDLLEAKTFISKICDERRVENKEHKERVARLRYRLAEVRS